MIEQVDFLVRMIAMGAALMLMAQVVAGDMNEKLKFPMVALIIGVMAYLIESSNLMVADSPLDPWINLVAIATPFWIWLVARRMFDFEPERRLALAALAALLIGWVVDNFVPGSGQLGFYLLHVISLVLIGDLLRLGMQLRKQGSGRDRGTIRLTLPLLIGELAGVVLLTEMIGGSAILHPMLSLASGILILMLALFAGLAMLRTEPELLGAVRPYSPASKPDASDGETSEETKRK